MFAPEQRNRRLIPSLHLYPRRLVGRGAEPIAYAPRGIPVAGSIVFFLRPFLHLAEVLYRLGFSHPGVVEQTAFAGGMELE